MFKRDVAYSIDWEIVNKQIVERGLIESFDWSNEFPNLPTTFFVSELDEYGVTSILDENMVEYTSDTMYVLTHYADYKHAYEVSNLAWTEKKHQSTKLKPHHVDWLNRNDGLYEVRPDNSFWTDSNNERIQNKILFVFKSTQFSFNQYGLSEAIDKAIELYPDS